MFEVGTIFEMSQELLKLGILPSLVVNAAKPMV
jgi:hypothetical protein